MSEEAQNLKKEIEEALKEAKKIEDEMKDLDSFYRDNGYERLGCIAHKVS